MCIIYLPAPNSVYIYIYIYTEFGAGKYIIHIYYIYIYNRIYIHIYIIYDCRHPSPMHILNHRGQSAEILSNNF